MRPVINYIACIMLCLPGVCLAQNDTPMEVLINIANQNERFSKEKLFQIDDRSAEYLDEFLADYTILKLDQEVLAEVLEKKPERILLPLPFDKSATFDLKMQSFDIHGSQFEVIERYNGEERTIQVPDGIFYRGIMERGADSQVGLSVFNDEVYGLFSSLEYGNVVLIKDPYKPGKFNQNYILYFEKDLLFERGGTCESDELKSMSEHDEYIDPDVLRSNVYESCDDVEIEIEATYGLYAQKGSLYSTVNYIRAFFNNVSIIYRNEGIYTSIARIIVNTSQDDYGSLNNTMAKLNKYGENVKNTYQSAGAELAHLVDYDQSVGGGIAWINAMCTNYYYFSAQNYHYGSYAYSSIHANSVDFPDYSYTVFVFSHEMGHNLGSNHTQWCGWDGGAIDNCAPTESVGGNTCDPGPAPTNGGTIMSYCHSSSYGINFSEGFGPQPGAVIRSSVQSKSCVEDFVPNTIFECQPSQTLTANRECTDDDEWTHYYNDNNTADETDDILILSVQKDGEDIGNLNDGSLLVQLKTSSNAGYGSTFISSPGYDANQDWHVMNRWFELIPTQEPNNPVRVKFYYTDEDYQDVVQNQSEIQSHTELTFFKIDNPGDPNPDNGHSNVSNNQINFYTNSNSASLSNWKYSQESGFHVAEFLVNSFSGGGGGFSQNAPGSFLPVELLYFEATEDDGIVYLDWATATEIENDYFLVERSLDGRDFETIGRINGLGNSYEDVYYEFIDRQAPTGKVYYRLSQYDFNGMSEYLGIDVIEIERKERITIYPNPMSNEVIKIEFADELTSDAEIRISSIDGKLMHRSVLESNRLFAYKELDLSQLDSGIYMVQIIYSGKQHITKLIKN